ncbi:hypothetical protein ES705_32959 [subsurface metagenome]
MGYTSGAYKLHIGTTSKYLMWDGVNLNIKGNLIITGGSGIANLTDAGVLATLDSIEYAAITGAKPPTNADNTASHPQSVAWLTNAGNLAYYNMVSEALLDSTIIIGGYIRTSLLTADNIRTGTLDAVRIKVGYGTNEDILFKQSGIRLYDAGSNNIFFTAANSSLTFNFGSNYVKVRSMVERLYLSNASKTLVFYDTGALQHCSVWYAPSGHQGDMIYNDQDDYFCAYIGGAFNRWGRVRVEDYW